MLFILASWLELQYLGILPPVLVAADEQSADTAARFASLSLSSLFSAGSIVLVPLLLLGSLLSPVPASWFNIAQAWSTHSLRSARSVSESFSRSAIEH